MYRKRICILLLLCVFVPLVFGACFAEQNENTLRLTMAGERSITMEYGTEFADPGAQAYYTDSRTGQEQPVQVNVSGTVDTQVVGSYTLRYMAQLGNRTCTVYRRVRVVDTQPPTITLTADPAYYTLPNAAYVEEGFSASDGYDGDLTDKVRRQETKDTVTYTVTDASGNFAIVTRQIVYNDPIPPELTLKGDDFVVVTAGDAYKEPGFTATDNCDGDITGKVSVSGSVNTYKTGTYTLTYTVSDAYKNSAKATRTVFVKEREVKKVNNTASADKVIYLTFDDGPSSHTERLLDVLKKYNVKATFFVVNTSYIGTVKRASQEGHTVAIHTATHKFKEIYASEQAYFADLEKMSNVIVEQTGVTPKLLRFPGGSSNTVSEFNKGIMTRLSALVEEKGYTYFDWNVDSNDAGGATSANTVYNNVVNGVSGKNSAVVLMHDTKGYTVDAIEKIIVWGLENGYSFQALTQDSPTCHHRIFN